MYRLFPTANWLFKHSYFLYNPLYSFYKILTDHAERKIIRAHVKKGMTALDIGANIGVYTKFIAQLVDKKGKVFAFEPDPRNFSHLKKNLVSFKKM